MVTTGGCPKSSGITPAPVITTSACKVFFTPALIMLYEPQPHGQGEDELLEARHPPVVPCVLKRIEGGEHLGHVLAHVRDPVRVEPPFEVGSGEELHQIAQGDDIPIEVRDEREVTHVRDCQIAPDGVRVLNVAFDVTPHRYVTGIITEKGIAYPPFQQSLRRMVEG